MDNSQKQIIGGKPSDIPELPAHTTCYRCKLCKRIFKTRPEVVEHLTVKDSAGRRLLCNPKTPDSKKETEKKHVVNNNVNNNDVKSDDRKQKIMILQDSNAEETGPTSTVQTDEGGNQQILEKKALRSVSDAKETDSTVLKPPTPLCSNATTTTPAELKPVNGVNNHNSTAVSNDISSITSMILSKQSTEAAQTKTKASVASTVTSIVADMEPPTNSKPEVPEVGGSIAKRRETTSRRKSSSVTTEASSETERVPLTRRQSSKTKESEEAKPETKATAKNPDNSAHLENKSDVKLNGVERMEEQNTNHLPEAMETDTVPVTDDSVLELKGREAQSRLSQLANSTKPNKIKSLRKKIYHCRHCEETFPFPIHVQVHMRKVHKKSESKITSADASPVKTESRNPNQYPLRSQSIRCKRKASISSMRRNEENEKPRRKPTKFTCRHCSKKFIYLSQLKIHQGKVHPEVTNGEIKIETQGIPKKRKVRRFRLTLKKRLFRKLDPVTESLPEQSTAPVESNGTNAFDVPSPVNNNNNREKPTRKRKRYIKFSCRHCSKKFPLLNDLRRHHQTDHSDLSNQRKAKPEAMEKVDPFPVPPIPSMPKSDEPDDQNNEPTAEEIEALDALMKAYSNESEGIIETPDSILSGLQSELSRTCPNCMKVFKFSGNLKNHWKVCGSAVRMEMDADDDDDEEMEENSYNGDEDEANENELNAGGYEGDESKVPFYEELDFRRCWICDAVVSRFHNLKRHLVNIHQIDMTYGDIRKKQSRILKSVKNVD